MAVTLATIWHDQPQFFTEKSCAQVVGMAGKGKLRDGSEASAQFREFLSEVPSSVLRRYVDDCLSEKSENAPYALQDIVNEIGSRLGFDVTFGRYRGVRSEIGFDGVWKSRDGHSLLLEVKTTDAYRINLDTIAHYRDSLIETDELSPSHSSILVSVGRQDTGDMEAQIRGSKHAWDIRLVSVDALVRLMSLKEQVSDWDTSSQINLLLRPVEYTRVDGIVDLLFLTAKDIDDPEVENQQLHNGDDVSQGPSSGTSDFDHERARNVALSLAEKRLGHTFKKKGRVFWSSRDGRVNLIILSSRAYGTNADQRHFWYGFKPGQKRFIEEADESYVMFACGHELSPVLFDCASFLSILENLKTTPPNPTGRDPLIHWHVTIYNNGLHAEVSTPLLGRRTDVTSFLVK